MYSSPGWLVLSKARANKDQSNGWVADWRDSAAIKICAVLSIGGLSEINAGAKGAHN